MNVCGQGVHLVNVLDNDYPESRTPRSRAHSEAQRKTGLAARVGGGLRDLSQIQAIGGTLGSRRDLSGLLQAGLPFPLYGAAPGEFSAECSLSQNLRVQRSHKIKERS